MYKYFEKKAVNSQLASSNQGVYWWIVTPEKDEKQKTFQVYGKEGPFGDFGKRFEKNFSLYEDSIAYARDLIGKKLTEGFEERKPLPDIRDKNLKSYTYSYDLTQVYLVAFNSENEENVEISQGFLYGEGHKGIFEYVGFYGDGGPKIFYPDSQEHHLIAKIRIPELALEEEEREDWFKSEQGTAALKHFAENFDRAISTIRETSRPYLPIVSLEYLKSVLAHIYVDWDDEDDNDRHDTIGFYVEDMNFEWTYRGPEGLTLDDVHRGWGELEIEYWYGYQDIYVCEMLDEIWSGRMNEVLVQWPD